VQLAPHTGLSSQSRNLRQHVLPDPQPISFGSISQGMPLLRTKMMPASAALSSMRGLPPFGFGGSGGKRGSIASHNSSDTSSFPIPPSVASVHGGFARSSKSLRTRDLLLVIRTPLVGTPATDCARTLRKDISSMEARIASVRQAYNGRPVSPRCRLLGSFLGGVGLCFHFHPFLRSWLFGQGQTRFLFLAFCI
jgi:hypothetical protein